MNSSSLVEVCMVLSCELSLLSFVDRRRGNKEQQTLNGFLDQSP